MLRLTIVVSLVACCSAVSTNCGSGQVCPVVVTARTDPATGNCSANASTIRSQIVSGLSSQLSGVSANLTTALNAKYLGLTAATAAQTCLQIKQMRPSATSGNYWILKASTPVQVYCEMSLVCNTTSGCSSFAGGWLQVAKLNMTDTSQTCPLGASGVGNTGTGLFKVDVTNGIRSCRRIDTVGSQNECNLGFMEVLGGFPYQEVCGRAIGYQWGSSDGITTSRTLNQAYIDGISLTRVIPPWTLTGGRTASTCGPTSPTSQRTTSRVAPAVRGTTKGLSPPSSATTTTASLVSRRALRGFLAPLPSITAMCCGTVSSAETWKPPAARDRGSATGSPRRPATASSRSACVPTGLRRPTKTCRSSTWSCTFDER